MSEVLALTEESENSTHRVEVVPVVLEPHGNADSLSVVQVWDYQVCVQTVGWEGVTQGAYVPPDSLVDTSRPEFDFLAEPGKTMARIKAKRLRGVVSYGLLVPAPEGSVIGDDVTAILGVEHYEAPIQSTNLRGSSKQVQGPAGIHPVYDVDALLRYAEVFEEGELVHVTEKIDGANARFTFVDGQMYVGSRKQWLEIDGGSLWDRILKQYPGIQRLCETFDGHTLYGEVYGNVQSLKYGLGDKIAFAAFDILGKDGGWWDFDVQRDICVSYNIPNVPRFECEGVDTHSFPFDLEYMKKQAEGPSLVPGANHYREGIVIKPITERYDRRVGRVQLKLVSFAYLEKSK